MISTRPHRLMTNHTVGSRSEQKVYRSIAVRVLSRLLAIAVIVLIALLFISCGSHRPVSRHPHPRHGEITAPIVPVPGHPQYHYGPEHWQCGINNNCELTRNWLDKDNRPVLSPLGCALSYTPIGWVFGDRPSMCKKK